MVIRGAKSVGEYKIREYMEELEEKGLMLENLTFEMIGQNEAELRDMCGSTMRLIYNPKTKKVTEFYT